MTSPVALTYPVAEIGEISLLFFHTFGVSDCDQDEEKGTRLRKKQRMKFDHDRLA
jgi:hypothetical protein